MDAQHFLKRKYLDKCGFYDDKTNIPFSFKLIKTCNEIVYEQSTKKL